MISNHAPLGWCRTDLMYCLSDLSWGAKLYRCVCTVLEQGICAVCVNGLIHGLHSTTQILVVINFDGSFQPPHPHPVYHTLTQYTTPTSCSPPVHSSQMPLLCPLEGFPSKGYVCSPTMLPAKHTCVPQPLSLPMTTHFCCCSYILFIGSFYPE